MPTLNLPLTEEPALLPGFDESALETARKGEHALLQAKRIAAYESYAKIPNPEAYHEEYRRMDPALFKFDQFSRLELPAEPIAYAAASVDAHYDLVISVSPEGYVVEDRAGVLENDAVTVSTLGKAAETHTSLVEQSLGSALVHEEQRKLFDLNSAFWNVGFFIHVKAKTELTGGILIRYP